MRLTGLVLLALFGASLALSHSVLSPESDEFSRERAELEGRRSLDEATNVGNGRAAIERELLVVKMQRARYLRAAEREKASAEREEAAATAAFGIYEGAKAEAHRDREDQALAERLREASRNQHRVAKRHRRSAKKHRRRSEKYYKKSTVTLAKRERKLQRRLERQGSRLERLMVRGHRDLSRARGLGLKLARYAGNAIGSRRRGRNCNDPTLRKGRRGEGKWVARRRTWAVRRMFRDPSTGIWYRSKSKKHLWRRCKWVINPTYASSLRVRANIAATNRNAYRNLLNADDKLKGRLQNDQSEVARLRARNEYLERLAGSSRVQQERLLKVMVKEKAKKEYSKYMSQFMQNYLNAGGRATGGSILGASNNVAAVNYPLGRRDRLDPQPGGSEYPYTGSLEPEQDDVSPPPSSGSVRNSRLSRIP